MNRKRLFRPGYGRKADDRDYQFSGVRSIRKSRYWPGGKFQGDQENKPHCVGYAWAHWLSSSPIASYLDPDGIYELAKYLDEWRGEAYEGTSVRAGAKVLQKLGFVSSYEFTDNLADTVDAICEIGPVVIGTEMLDGMFEPNSDARIFAVGESYGGHAHLLDGVHREKRLLRERNSYGLEWGQSGRAWMDFDDFERLLELGAEVCVARAANPEPR